MTLLTVRGGAKIDKMKADKKKGEEDMIIEVNNLVKRYKDLVALDHFNLQVNKGEIYGLLGPNGSGKTTAINCMLSHSNPVESEIRLFGEPMAPDNSGR